MNLSETPLTLFLVAMKVLVDDFRCLSNRVLSSKDTRTDFPPEVVMRLSNETVRDIAAESEESQVERRRLEAKSDSLEGGLQVLQGLARRRTAGP